MRSRHIGLVDRRGVVAGLAGAVVAGGVTGGGALPALASAPRPIVRRKVGSIELVLASDGHIELGLGFALPATDPGEVTKVLAAAGREADRIRAETNVALVRSGKDAVLIDAGSGANFMPTAGRLQATLEAAGVSLDEITAVVVTHGHPDHLWGVLDDFNEPRFPNATVILGAVERDYWIDPETVSRVPEGLRGFAAGSARILKALGDRVRTVKPGEAVASGIAVLASAGHTPGHLSVMIESGSERLLVGGDVLAHPVISFERPDWVWGPDGDAAVAAATRRRLLDMLAVDRLPLLGYHLPWPGIGRVERKDAGYRLVME